MRNYSNNRNEGGRRTRRSKTNKRKTSKVRGGIFGFHDRKFTNEEINDYNLRIIKLEADKKSATFLLPKLKNEFLKIKKEQEEIIKYSTKIGKDSKYTEAMNNRINKAKGLIDNAKNKLDNKTKELNNIKKELDELNRKVSRWRW